MKNLQEVVEKASLAETYKGRRDPHQARIKKELLEKLGKCLTKKLDELSNCKNFDCLLKIVEACAKQIKGIGELTIYDTALRIGFYLDIYPDKVYLQGQGKGPKD